MAQWHRRPTTRSAWRRRWRRLRIIKALGLKPRRTIRIGLWTGEEQGRLGSRATSTSTSAARPPAWGSAAPAAEKKDAPDSAQNREYENFSAYYNLDNGTGKIRGVYLQGNEALRPLFRKWLVPFHDLGAQTITVSNTGGTDHQSFDGIGLPGFQFIQDEIDYNSRTHHSNMDVYDRAQADDLKQASVIMATFLYNTAMSDEKPTRSRPPAPPRAATSTSSRLIPALAARPQQRRPSFPRSGAMGVVLRASECGQAGSRITSSRPTSMSLTVSR
ncbi:MAG: M28 family peptidase [Isosphaeraceae bacterium]